MDEVKSKCPFHNIENINEFDALNESARANPWPYYDWLRDDSSRSVYKLPHEKSFYVVHRYDDVNRILADTENFSSKIIPVAKSPFFVLMDGDEHKRIRSIVSEVLSQKNSLLWQPEIDKIVQEETLGLINAGEAELFERWADKIPLRILSYIFGMSQENHAIKALHNHAIAINRALFVTGGTGPRRSNKPNMSEKLFITFSLMKNLRKVLKLRKLIGKKGMSELSLMLKNERQDVETPRPDFRAIPHAISPLLDLMIHFAEVLQPQKTNNDNSVSTTVSELRSAIQNNHASITEMIMAGAFILFAGYETTSSILSNCFVHLAGNPDTFNQLKKNPDQLENFIEESLRFYTPVGRFLRRANKDMTIDGILIPKDAMLLLLIGAANSDSAKFNNGCTFDTDRVNNRQHLSFGKGAHYCIGAPLARLQITLALNELIKRATSLSVNENTTMKMVVDRDNGIFRFEKIWAKVE